SRAQHPMLRDWRTSIALRQTGICSLHCVTPVAGFVPPLRPVRIASGDPLLFRAIPPANRCEPHHPRRFSLPTHPPHSTHTPPPPGNSPAPLRVLARRKPSNDGSHPLPSATIQPDGSLCVAQGAPSRSTLAPTTDHNHHHPPQG